MMPDDATDRPVELIRALETLDTTSASKGMQDRVLASIERPHRARSRRPRGWVLAAAATLVASAVAAAVSGWPTVGHPLSSEQAPALSAPASYRATSETAPNLLLAPVESAWAPVPSASAAHPRTSTPAKPGSSELAQQVASYDRAVALMGKNDDAALAAFRSMRARWPNSPLVHEVDLRILELLVRTGRTQQSRDEAESFLKRHPDSPKADEVDALRDAGADKKK